MIYLPPQKLALAKAIRLACLLTLPLVLGACNGVDSGSSGGSKTPVPPPSPLPPPPAQVTTAAHQVTPSLAALVVTDVSGPPAAISVSIPGAASFDTYAGGPAPAWCTGTTCSNPCPGIRFSLAPGTSCDFYIHAKNSIAAGGIPVTGFL